MKIFNPINTLRETNSSKAIIQFIGDQALSGKSWTLDPEERYTGTKKALKYVTSEQNIGITTINLIRNPCIELFQNRRGGGQVTKAMT